MTDSKQPIKGKVAKILNSRELVINLGLKDGVKEGMKFGVLDPKGEDIKDPETGELLGSVERTKVKVKVTLVKEKLSVASTYKKTQVNLGGTGNLFSLSFANSLLPPKWVTKYEDLKTSEQTWESLDEAQSYVKTGDPVVQLGSEVEEDS